MPFSLPAYLDRIGLETCEPTVQGLKALQSAQMSAIPFENVLPFLGRIPDVSLPAIWNKTVVRRRGGYCFELNTLFGAALEAVGFSARPVLARVRKGPPDGWNRSHLAFVVTIDGEEWLADCGFGGPAPAEPLQLGTQSPQTARTDVFQIASDSVEGEQVLERQMPEGWLPLYSFDRVAPKRPDIEGANYLCATWDRKPFVGNLMFARLTATGRVSFLNGAARRRDDGDGDAWQIQDKAGFAAFVSNDIGLDYDAETVEALWDRLSSLHPVP